MNDTYTEMMEKLAKSQQDDKNFENSSIHTVQKPPCLQTTLNYTCKTLKLYTFVNTNQWY